MDEPYDEKPREKKRLARWIVFTILAILLLATGVSLLLEGWILSGIAWIVLVVSLSTIGSWFLKGILRPIQRAELIHGNATFSLYRPQTVERDLWYSLLFFASGTAGERNEKTATILEAEVAKRAEQLLGHDTSGHRKLDQDSSAAIPKGSILRIVPHMPGVEFNPKSRSLKYLETVHCEQFRFHVKPDTPEGVRRGTVSVFSCGLLVAEINLSIGVVSEGSLVAPSTPVVREHGRSYRKIFVSYSHKDVEIVENVQDCARLCSCHR